MKDIDKSITTIIGAMLLFAVFPLPYGYYIFLRLIVFVGSLFLAYKLYEKELSGWLVVMILVGILFNPIIPVYLSREVWLFIDLVCAGLFFYISNLFGDTRI